MTMTMMMMITITIVQVDSSIFDFPSYYLNRKWSILVIFFHSLIKLMKNSFHNTDGDDDDDYGRACC